MRHGAKEIDTPVFEVRETLTGKYGADNAPLVYNLEDQGGELLSMRFDLTVPLARYVACRNVSFLKRFHIAKVYRRDQPNATKSRFREFYQCDFDIVGMYDQMQPDAEVLMVVCEVLTELNLDSKFTIKVNNRRLLLGVMEMSNISLEKFKHVCRIIDKLDKVRILFFFIIIFRRKKQNYTLIYIIFLRLISKMNKL